MTKLSKRMLIAGLLVAAVVGGLGYFQLVFKPNMIAGIMAKAAPPPASVTTQAANSEPWSARISAVGTVVATQGIDVASQVPGVVVSIAGENGREVDKGAVLFELDRAIELADLASAGATLREAEVNFERQSDLIAKKVTSEANLDIARTRRDTADAAVKRISAVIAQKTIKAPFAGRLGIRKVEVGQYVSPGMALVSLQALDPIYVDFPVPEQAIGQLALGKPVELTVDTYPGIVFKGSIETLDARVAAETRTLQVRASVPNPDRKLLPGMFANVAVIVGAPSEVVTIPRTAVSYSLYGDTVFVVGAADKPTADGIGTIDRRVVQLGDVQGDRIVVRTGVKAGEQVVTGGQMKLQQSSRVRVDNTQTLKPAAERPRQ
jgi:membrane fusion protein (multidrug efflux system)